MKKMKVMVVVTRGGKWWMKGDEDGGYLVGVVRSFLFLFFFVLGEEGSCSMS